jgi:membrane protease subunit HflK
MPPNDPQWNRRKNEGPPDLDEVWRRLNQKLSNLFRGRKGAPPPGDFRQYRGGFGFIVLLVVALWAASGFYIVDAGERGVVLRFGKYSETTDPGLHWHLPYPIESREIVDMARVRTVEVGYRNNVKSKVPKEALMLTDDENIVDLQFAVQYTIKDAEDFLFNNRSPEDSVLQAAETAIREIVGKNGMDFVLYEGRAEIAANARKLMQDDILDRYKTGINISSVSMQNAQPPEQVQAAFDDAVKAGQDRERKINEGHAYANEVINAAKGGASRLSQEAQGYRTRVIESAEGEAARFTQIVTEYAKAPDVTRERLYLEAMQQVLSNTSTVLIDQKGGSNLLYLPLDKIIQGTAQQQASQSAKNSSPEAAAPDTSARSRDALRTREREQRQ